MKALTREDVREVVEEVFDRKFDQKFDQKFDERIQPFIVATQLEFQRIEQKIENGINHLSHRFDQAFQKLDNFTSMYKRHDEQITMLSGQTRRLNDKVDSLDKRVTKLES